MYENDLLKFHRELVEIKTKLLTNESQTNLTDQERFAVATKIDLTVSRLLRLLDYLK